MNNDQYKKDFQQLRRREARIGIIAIVLALAVLVEGLIIFRTLGMERVIVTPPNITRSFWVSHDKVSSEYLEMMAGFVCWLVLDVTPDSLGWKKKALLSIMAPEATGEMNTKMDLEGERLKKLNASTYFSLQQLYPNEDTQSVRAVGLLHTQINGKETTPRQATYVIQFAYRGGREHLATFKEDIKP